MQFRQLGKTGLNIGVIGLGTEHLAKQNKTIIQKSVQAALKGNIS